MGIMNNNQVNMIIEKNEKNKKNEKNDIKNSVHHICTYCSEQFLGFGKHCSLCKLKKMFETRNCDECGVEFRKNGKKWSPLCDECIIENKTL